jgi:hypothetical protein
MRMTDERMPAVGDERALRMLAVLGEAHREAVPDGAARGAVARALGEVVDTRDVSAPSDGEAARLALQLLAAEPRFAGPIAALESGPRTRGLGGGVVEGACVIAGLLLALQTYFEFERDKDGRWSVKLRKKPPGSGMILSFSGSGGAGRKVTSDK